MAGDYACPTCDKTFTRTTHVVRHQRIHTNTRPYPCTSCHERFTRSDLVTRHRIKFHPSEELRPQAGIESAVLPTRKQGRMTLSNPEHEREGVSGLRGGPNKDMTCSLSDVADDVARPRPAVDCLPSSSTVAGPVAGTWGADAGGRSSGADGDMDAYYQTHLSVGLPYDGHSPYHSQQDTYPAIPSEVAFPPPFDPSASAWSSARSGSGSGSSFRSFQPITPAQPHQTILPTVGDQVDSPAAYVPHLSGQNGLFEGWDASGMDEDSQQQSSDWVDSNNMYQQSGQSYTESDWTYETDPQPPPPPPTTAAPASLLLPHYNVDAGLVAYNRQQIPVDPYQQLARHLMATAEKANPAAPAPPPFPYPEPHGTQAGETDAFADALRRRNGSGGGAFELSLGRRG